MPSQNWRPDQCSTQNAEPRAAMDHSVTGGLERNIFANALDCESVTMRRTWRVTGKHLDYHAGLESRPAAFAISNPWYIHNH